MARLRRMARKVSWGALGMSSLSSAHIQPWGDGSSAATQLTRHTVTFAMQAALLLLDMHLGACLIVNTLLHVKIMHAYLCMAGVHAHFFSSAEQSTCTCKL